jgi:hypothetical protein
MYCAISRTDQTEFDGSTFTGNIASVVQSNYGQASAPLQKTVNNRDYQFYQ